VSTLSFDDADAYERFMGRWSRAAGERFIGWLAPPEGQHCLDVGCGTGIFTHVIGEKCAPRLIAAIDPSLAQVQRARAAASRGGTHFQIAAAEALPFRDSIFDVVLAGLVINFVANRRHAVREMRRVARPGAIVGAYVWDFETERSPSGPMRRALRRLQVALPEIPGTHASSLPALTSVFAGVGLVDVSALAFDVSLSFRSFEECWQSQAASYGPIGAILASMSVAERVRLKAAVRDDLAAEMSGPVICTSRVHAVQGRVSQTPPIAAAGPARN
jgi:ubiquinone/menaquinone biosynthesis C-methylase UbiE